MKAPCYNHDGYDSYCNDCRELNGLKPRKPMTEKQIARSMARVLASLSVSTGAPRAH